MEVDIKIRPTATLNYNPNKETNLSIKQTNSTDNSMAGSQAAKVVPHSKKQCLLTPIQMQLTISKYYRTDSTEWLLAHLGLESGIICSETTPVTTESLGAHSELPLA
ncbi:hypothetical protein EVAR_60877_1 [Eumeta japonica]|uniref:Uncharacterized protein n=1 Tax=Eumeta variegata TaxID=151549 RepID=A0A4C1YIQ3_EUMVA|nr:hypothetical protein EVAR_60877_1 [Eumeta japonica]